MGLFGKGEGSEKGLEIKKEQAFEEAKEIFSKYGLKEGVDYNIVESDKDNEKGRYNIFDKTSNSWISPDELKKRGPEWYREQI